MIHHDKSAAFLTRARAGRVCLGCHASTLSAPIVEMMGGIGLDFVILGTETESIDPSMIEALLRAADTTSMVPIVKVRRHDAGLVVDALNAGAPFVSVPHVRSRREIDALVEASRFAPQGTRGLCLAARFSGFGADPIAEAVERSNTAPAIVPILEDRECLDDLDAVMAAPGVEIYELGPVDLSQSLGVPPERGYGNPETAKAIDRICAAARRHNKLILAPMRMPPEGTIARADAVESQRALIEERGVNLLYYTADILLLARALRAVLGLRDVTR